MACQIHQFVYSMSKEPNYQQKLYKIRNNPTAVREYSITELRELIKYITSSPQNRKQFGGQYYDIFNEINSKLAAKKIRRAPINNKLGQLNAKATGTVGTFDRVEETKKEQANQIAIQKQQAIQVFKEKTQSRSTSPPNKKHLYPVVRFLSQPLYFIQESDERQKKKPQHQSSERSVEQKGIINYGNSKPWRSSNLQEGEFGEEQQPFLYQIPTSKQSKQSSTKFKIN